MKILTNKSLIIKKNCKNFINGIIDTILLKKFSKKNFSKLFFLGLLIAIVGDDLKDLIPTLWIPLYFRYSCAVN